MLSLVGGYSAALFCYGQTGSGKTHTMFGADGALDGCLASAEAKGGGGFLQMDSRA